MDATLIGQNRRADVGLVGNLACTFELLLDEMKTAGVKLDYAGCRDELRKNEVEEEKKVEAALEQRRGPDRPAAHVPGDRRLSSRSTT